MVAKDAYTHLRSNDEHEAHSNTVKARERYMELRSFSRFIVMNARTCHLATQDWVSRNITRAPDGMPIWKNGAGKKNNPWTMTFRFNAEGANAALFLKLGQAAPERRVRCWDLRSGEQRSKIAVLLVGYEHILNDFEGEASGSEAESEPTDFGDEQGLEGLVSMFVWDMLGGHATK